MRAKSRELTSPREPPNNQRIKTGCWRQETDDRILERDRYSVYRIFKLEHSLEPYFYCVTNKAACVCITQSTINNCCDQSASVHVSVCFFGSQYGYIKARRILSEHNIPAETSASSLKNIKNKSFVKKKKTHQNQIQKVTELRAAPLLQ